MVRLLPFVVCLVSLWVVYLLVTYVGKTLPLVEEERETTWASTRSQPISSGKFDDLEERFRFISQGEVGLMMVWLKYMTSSGSKRAEALEEIRVRLTDRARIDFQIEMIGVLLFGSEDAHSILYSKRKDGSHLVNDFACIKSRGYFFEKHCGVLSRYGMKLFSSFANICNHLVAKEAYEAAVLDTCGKKVVIPYFNESNFWTEEDFDF